MKKRWGFVCLCLLMTGCARLSDVDESFLKETKEPEVEQDDTPAVMQCDSETQGTLTFEAKGDQIQKMTQTFSMSFADLGISEDLDQNAIKEKINQSLESMYQDLEGVQAVGEIVEGHVEITVTIDYTVADHDQLMEAGLLESGKVDSAYISLEETQESYEDSGYTCTIE
ncbi:DUF1307 domain-containing protein [uncultured Faecalicoccus sp.]|uniref:DUF1307 domain-containing protein n=1 Tax=uncultured Faecalicoccus sp. TaxID=1971760 RepID=UPI0025EB50C5|nr:DUF1307 domain-containing protein [uncultured Faecalicoccus sp.]